VPFADPRLAQVRARAETGAPTAEWEALIGGGVKPTRLPWQQLTGILKFPPRDMALYFALSARGDKGLDPWVVRELAAETDRDHGADKPARARHAELARGAQAERDRALDTLLGLAEGLGADGGKLAALAEGFAALGVPGADPAVFPDGGRLGRAAGRLEAFRADIRRHERETAGTDAQRTLLVAFAATQFRDVLRKAYAGPDELARDLRRTLAGCEAALETLARARRQVAFALDGWEPCLDVWDEARRRGSGAPQDAVDFIVKIMPTLPRGEAGGAEAQACWDGIDRQRDAFVRAKVDWIDRKDATG
jgi:hypothetical protein